ncbi:hypothetical protein BON30_08025 [Cystobacter ferrugineus]|uniref:DUF5673 domain-containing protein n=1 Tax=Cystobacter ferrugineus TaxID=83449 RepID=A0A1L9BF24_9BACT|nr:hypothetical protein BON30_08025 [Cystobacter ferrugineus]
MRVPSFPTRVIAFHALALVAFLGDAVWLVRESRALGGRQAALELAVAVAAGGVALLSLVALVSLLRARAVVVLASRASSETYLQVMGVMAVLLLFGVQVLSTGTRPALGAFCLMLSAWLMGVGLHLVPALLLSSEGFVDQLGKRTRFSELEWFELRRTQDTPPRTLLRAGRGDQLHIHTRLVDLDAEALRKVLVRAGLSAKAPRG